MQNLSPVPMRYNSTVILIVVAIMAVFAESSPPHMNAFNAPKTAGRSVHERSSKSPMRAFAASKSSDTPTVAGLSTRPPLPLGKNGSSENLLKSRGSSVSLNKAWKTQPSITVDASARVATPLLSKGRILAPDASPLKTESEDIKLHVNPLVDQPNDLHLRSGELFSPRLSISS